MANAALPPNSRAVYIVPNFHPASCGWLASFSRERIYCANSYLDHLDRVRDGPHYSFALSEANNIIAIMDFQPQRIDELRGRIRGGRVELVNAFFLEPTINLSGGEALVRLGIEGLRWQEQVFGSRPRFAWTIDVCGIHDQMAQIAAGPTPRPLGKSRTTLRSRDCKGAGRNSPKLQDTKLRKVPLAYARRSERGFQ